MRKSILLFFTLFCLAAASGCVYRASMSQGNLIKQEDLDQVEVGMTMTQVRFLLGTPMIDDPFSRNRWDYVYYLKIGRKDAGQKRWVSVYFADEKVSEIRQNQELAPNL
jgi:outer membrane protein assembly factor BamE